MAAPVQHKDIGILKDHRSMIRNRESVAARVLLG
jgi:hypothetical protein